MKLNQKGLASIVIIIITAIFSLVAAGATWYFMDQQSQKQRAESDQKTKDLEKQIEELKKEKSEAEGEEGGTGGTDKTASQEEKTAIGKLLESYNTKIKKCSATAPDMSFIPCVQNNLSDILGEDALNQVLNKEVYMKTTSSPSPGEIEIDTIQKRSDTTFYVKTKFYVTLQEKNTGYYPTDFTIQKDNNKYTITNIKTGESVDL